MNDIWNVKIYLLQTNLQRREEDIATNNLMISRIKGGDCVRTQTNVTSCFGIFWTSTARCSYDICKSAKPIHLYKFQSYVEITNSPTQRCSFTLMYGDVFIRVCICVTVYSSLLHLVLR